MRALSQHEVVLFQKAAGADARGIIFTFLLASLMRPSEALALQWKDVNLAKGSVEVRRTLAGCGRTPGGRRKLGFREDSPRG